MVQDTDWKLHTDGNGLWTDRAREVTVTGYDLDIDSDNRYGELFVYTKDWNVEREGLIYTDKLFLTELRDRLTKAYGPMAASDVDYSEHGMQGRDYVSLDAGTRFVEAFKRVHGC